MNPGLIPFVIVPVLFLIAGVAMIVVSVGGYGAHNTFMILGCGLTGIAILLPVLFAIVTRPRKKR